MAHLNECHELVEMVMAAISLSFLYHPAQLYPQLKESMNEEETEEETELDEDEDGGDDDGKNYNVHNVDNGLKISSG
jgi:hypothetical protein